MPNVNLQPKCIIITLIIISAALNITQQPHSNNVVEPIVFPIAGLKQYSQLQPTTRLRGPRSLDENIRAVVRVQIVPCVCAEDTCCWVGEAPVGAEGEDGALKMLVPGA